MLVYGMGCSYTVGWGVSIQDDVLVYRMGCYIQDGVLIYGMGR